MLCKARNHDLMTMIYNRRYTIQSPPFSIDIESGVHRFKYPPCRRSMAVQAETPDCSMSQRKLANKATIRSDQMEPQGEFCDCCHQHHSDTKFIGLGVNIRACDRCYHWARSSIARTRNIPAWLRPDESMGFDEISNLRAQASRISRRSRRRLLFHLGRNYLGPLTDDDWRDALSHLDFKDSAVYSPSRLQTLEIENELQKLSDAGVVYVPENRVLRADIVHLMNGSYGYDNKQLFVTILFTWLVGEDDFIGRNPEPWAKSFQFLFEVIDDLDDRAYFVRGALEVIGSSGNIYRIQPRATPPFYHVARNVEGRYRHICIDPIGPANVVFGDILVTLVLSLYDDEMSARQINTLAPHVFGEQRSPHLIRRRNINIENLWRRALGNMPQNPLGGMDDSDPDIAATNMQYIIDRFQTNLADWTREMEDEE